MVTSAPAYPVLQQTMPQSMDSGSQRKMVRVRYPYTAQRKDELTIKPGKYSLNNETMIVFQLVI